MYLALHKPCGQALPTRVYPGCESATVDGVSFLLLRHPVLNDLLALTYRQRFQRR
jgi:hypothetical protein